MLVFSALGTMEGETEKQMETGEETGSDGDDSICVSCYHPTQTVLLPCRHHMCDACSSRWLIRRPLCPMCRGGVIGTQPSSHRPTRLRHIHASDDSPDVGITLTNAESGGAVRVLGVRKRSMAHQCGVRVGDVITHINGIRVCEHQFAVLIVNASHRAGTPIVCSLQAPTDQTSTCAPLWTILTRRHVRVRPMHS